MSSTDFLAFGGGVVLLSMATFVLFCLATEIVDWFVKMRKERNK